MDGNNTHAKDMKKLRISFFLVVIVCIGVFVFLTAYMSSRSEETLRSVSNIYMAEINKQIQEKYASVTSVQLTQLKGVYLRTPPNSDMKRKEIYNELRISAQVREFSSLAFLTKAGDMEVVYGDRVEIIDSNRAFNDLAEDGEFIARGFNTEDEAELILGIAARYEMNNGRTSDALVMSVSMDYLRESLFLHSNKEGVHFHIIDTDGSYITSNEDFFSDVLNEYPAIDRAAVSGFVEELKVKMATGDEFFTFFNSSGGDVHIYCTPIESNNDWYLIASMPEGSLGQAINELDQARTGMMIISILIIVLSMLAVFSMYSRMTHNQIKELADSQVEVQRASMAKSEFLASMSHDIRTPMNAIIGMSELASRNAGDEELVREYVGKIRLSSKHLLGLINDVLDMSKIESGKIEIHANNMSIRDTMDDIVNMVQPQLKAKDQKFDIFIGDIMSENVYCDSVRLNQVLINLLSNAVKYTPENGRINVRFYQDVSPKGDEYVRSHFIVEDNGIGMSEEFQKKIYDTFSREETEYTHRITGSGLGMAITKSIVELMGGTIDLDSELGKGSKFHVTLDLKRCATSEDEMKLPQWNVLVVDDNEELCISAVANLKDLGANAEWVTDGNKAVEMIVQHHEANTDYNFVLIDWKMPGLDGVQTINKIRETVGTDIPLFLISAYDWGDAESEINSLPIEGFIPKPLFRSTLFERLEKYIEGHTPGEKKEEEQEIDFTGKRVLLAEDIDINWEIANEILSLTGLELERAENGKVCVEMFNNSPLGYYDAVLMDVRMPVMNGYDATRAIRQLEREDKDLPIIAMTADAFNDDIKVCLECGMNGHIAKPVDFKEANRTLQRFLYPDSSK